MDPRHKKLIGIFALCAGLFFYVAGALAIGDFVIGNKALELVYFVIAGVAWVWPAGKLIAWMSAPAKTEA